MVLRLGAPSCVSPLLKTTRSAHGRKQSRWWSETSWRWKAMLGQKFTTYQTVRGEFKSRLTHTLFKNNRSCRPICACYSSVFQRFPFAGFSFRLHPDNVGLMISRCFERQRQVEGSSVVHGKLQFGIHILGVIHIILRYVIRKPEILTLNFR